MQNDDDSPTKKMKESLNVVMKSSNFHAKFKARPKENKMKILAPCK